METVGCDVLDWLLQRNADLGGGYRFRTGIGVRRPSSKILDLMCNDSKGFAVGAIIGLDYDQASSPKGETTVSERDPRAADDRFHSTRWSEVLAARDLASPQARAGGRRTLPDLLVSALRLRATQGFHRRAGRGSHPGIPHRRPGAEFSSERRPGSGKVPVVLAVIVRQLPEESTRMGESIQAGRRRAALFRSMLKRPKPATCASRNMSRRPSGCTTAAGRSPCSTTRSTNWSGR